MPAAAAQGESLDFGYMEDSKFTGENQYVSSILTDESGAIQYYSKLCGVSGTGEGTASVHFRQVADGNYKLQLFSEQANDPSKSDGCSSTGVEYAVKVESGKGMLLGAVGKPADLHWSEDDFGTDAWAPVQEHAADYRVQLFQRSSATTKVTPVTDVISLGADQLSYNFSAWIEEPQSEQEKFMYFFSVGTIGESGYSDSDMKRSTQEICCEKLESLPSAIQWDTQKLGLLHWQTAGEGDSTNRYQLKLYKDGGVTPVKTDIIARNFEKSG